MPRKCCTLWDGESCDSGQPGTDFKGVIFTFPSGGARIRSLTGDTANAFHRTLHAMVYIIKKLLDVGFDYVLPGKIQSDRLRLVSTKALRA